MSQTRWTPFRDCQRGVSTTRSTTAWLCDSGWSVSGSVSTFSFSRELLVAAAALLATLWVTVTPAHLFNNYVVHVCRWYFCSAYKHGGSWLSKMHCWFLASDHRTSASSEHWAVIKCQTLSSDKVIYFVDISQRHCFFVWTVIPDSSEVVIRGGCFIWRFRHDCVLASYVLQLLEKLQ